MIQHISTQQAQELLRHNRVGRLGCVIGETPYVVPVSYMYDGEHIYLHSLAGRKVDAMRANPNVCLQVDQVENEFHWDSVIAFGVYEEITDADERDRVLDRLIDRFPHFTPVESAMAQSEGLPQTIVFRIRVETLTGVAERI